MSSMQGSDKLDEFKDQLTPCLACGCAEMSCGPICPFCFAAGKVCCCTQSVGLECPPCWCECNEECNSQDRGICESSQKFCCLYTEVQFPPSQDIGEHGQASAKQLNEFKGLEVLYMMDPIDVDAV